MFFDNITINFDDGGRVIIDDFEVEFVDVNLLSTEQFELIKEIQTIISRTRKKYN